MNGWCMHILSSERGLCCVAGVDDSEVGVPPPAEAIPLPSPRLTSHSQQRPTPSQVCTSLIPFQRTSGHQQPVCLFFKIVLHADIHPLYYECAGRLLICMCALHLDTWSYDPVLPVHMNSFGCSRTSECQRVLQGRRPRDRPSQT